MFSITDLKTEYQSLPLGIDENPRFSWILNSDKNDTVQEAYRLSVSADGEPVWDTGKVQRADSVLVEYAGSALKPCTNYQVMLQVWDNHGQSAETSSFFETGLMGGYKAKWISHHYDEKFEPCPVFIKEFEFSGEVKSARLYASALGIYEVNINGQKTGDAFFAPGWTSYHKRLQYQTYDITAMLLKKNRIGITVANGWYSGILGWDPKPYRSKCKAVWAQIEITFADGSSKTIISDESWQYGTGSVRYAEIYHGQIIDNNFSVSIDGSAKIFNPPEGFNPMNFNPMDVLVAQECEPVRITERIQVQKFTRSPKGEAIFDFGQNLTGFVEAKFHCPKGTVVTIRHAEVLDKDGNFYTDNLRQARATDTFICSGNSDGEVFIPSLTFHGFRYIAVDGLGETPCADWFTACVLHTDMEKGGSFECSHNGVNRLQQNIQWGQRGNFLDIPTDCPQRDERLGWTGDAQVFAYTAAFNYNVALFFTKWLRDLKADQSKTHGVPHIVPNIFEEREGATAWSDAATIVPWTMFEVYADKRLLANQYESMKDWVEYIRSKAGDNNLWQSGFHYGDWLSLDRPEGSDCVGATDVYFIASAFYAYSCMLTAQTAQTLGYNDEAAHYRDLHKKITDAFQKEYITQTGRLVCETQTACLLALHFNLVQPQFRQRVLQSLVSNLSKRNNHLATGFVGTPYLCHVLSDNGYHEIAAEVFLQEDYPSWLNTVNLGATTIWERWSSLRADGSFDNAGMNSFNHYAYGSIGSWMYQKIGGLQILEPGYKKSRIAPMPIKGISYAKTVCKTIYGILSSEWRIENGVFKIDINVPCNTSAVVKLPSSRLPGSEEDIVVGSGEYHFEGKIDLA